MRNISIPKQQEVKVTFRVSADTASKLNILLAEINLATGNRITKNQLGISALRVLFESWEELASHKKESIEKWAERFISKYDNI
jgi:hypothetical protein